MFPKLVALLLSASLVSFSAEVAHCPRVQHLHVNLDNETGRLLADRLDSIGSLSTWSSAATTAGAGVAKAAAIDPSGTTLVVVGAIATVLAGGSAYLAKHFSGEVRRAIGPGGIDIDLQRIHGVPVVGSAENLLSKAVSETFGSDGDTEQDACTNKYLLLGLFGNYDPHELPRIAAFKDRPMTEGESNQLRSFFLTGVLLNVKFSPLSAGQAPRVR